MTSTINIRTTENGTTGAAAIEGRSAAPTGTGTRPPLPRQLPRPRAQRADEAGGRPAPVIITATRDRRRVTLRVSGQLDRVGVARLRTAIARARTEGTPRVVVDLAAVTGWDAALPRVLAWAWIQLSGHDQGLVLTGTPTSLHTAIRAAHDTLAGPLWRGPRPGQPIYWPETADQP